VTQDPLLFEESVPAGFATVIDGFAENTLNLHSFLVKNPVSTFFVRVKGDSMINAGILDGDLLVVDRSIEGYDGKVIVARLEGAFTVKRFLKTDDKVLLLPENPKYSPVVITQEIDFEVWGVVTHAIHKV